MRIVFAATFLVFALVKPSQAQDPITLIASTLIPKLVEGTNTVIDKVKENKAATKEKVREKTQASLDQALKKMQQENIDNLESLGNAIRKSNDRVSELKKVYENVKEILYPLGNLQALTDPNLHQGIAGSTELKKIVINNYLSTWNDLKPYFENISKLRDDEQWKDPANKVALINDVKDVFGKLNKINGIVMTDVKRPTSTTPDADIEDYRKAIAASSHDIAAGKEAVTEILDLLTARLSLGKNETDDLIEQINKQKSKIVIPQ